MTSTIYETDGGWATGRSRQIADTDGCPQGWVRASAPPEPPDGHRSHWAVTGWAYELIDQPAPPPDVAPLAQLKDECIACIDKWHEDALLTLTGKPTQAEQTTWAGKVVLAETIMAGGALTPSQTAFLTALGVPVAGYADYASAVLAKSALFWGIVGMADKVRSQCKDRVLGARTHAELEDATASNFAQRDAALSAVMARMQRVTS